MPSYEFSDEHYNYLSQASSLLDAVEVPTADHWRLRSFIYSFNYLGGSGPKFIVDRVSSSSHTKTIEESLVSISQDLESLALKCKSVVRRTYTRFIL